MAASDHLGIQFEHSDLGIEHSIKAVHPEHGVIGSMYWRKTPGQKWGHHQPAGTITEISVDKSHQRQGIATGMYQAAQEHSPRPVHASDPTPDGAAWARSVG